MRARVRAMVCRGRLSWRSPERLRRWRVVSPEDAGMGAAPEKAANAAPEPNRPVCDQLIRTWAALIAPTPSRASSCGWAEVTRWVISRSRSSASARSVRMRVAVDRRGPRVEKRVVTDPHRRAPGAAATDPEPNVVYPGGTIMDVDIRYSPAFALAVDPRLMCFAGPGIEWHPESGTRRPATSAYIV
jgi:hypothetical protein